MYPLQNDALWPRNQWYIAGWSTEFGEAPIERTILGARVLLFRSAVGDPVVLDGLCPHRFMPLVKGTLTAGEIECAYHGMRFDSTGACTMGPALSNARGAARLRRFATLERGPLVWVWTGRADEADTARLPDMSKCGLATEGWRADPNEAMHFNARYMLMIDNLFNLSHIGWVHQTLLGRPTICATPAVVSRGVAMLRSERREISTVDGFTRFLFPESVGPIEQVLATDFLGPGLITAIGPAVSESSESPIAGKIWGEVHFVHGITPETPATTTIYSIVSRNFRLDDDALSAALCAQNKAVLLQDREIAESIERALATAETSAEMSFQGDHGAIEARRTIQKLIDEEQ